MRNAAEVRPTPSTARIVFISAILLAASCDRPITPATDPGARPAKSPGTGPATDQPVVREKPALPERPAPATPPDAIADDAHPADDPAAPIGQTRAAASHSTVAPGPDSTPSAPLAKSPQPVENPVYREHIARARAEMMKNQYYKVLRHCRSALEVQPDDVLATSICSIAACRLKRGPLARRYYRRLPASRKTPIRSICLKSGVRDFE